MVNNKINNIAKWMDKNKLYVNSNKTQYMLFPNNITKDCTQIFVNISNNNLCIKTKLSQITRYKYLRVTVDYELTWKEHVTNTCKMHWNNSPTQKSVLPRSFLLSMHYCFAHSFIQNGITAWGNGNKSILIPLFKLHNNILKLFNAF